MARPREISVTAVRDAALDVFREHGYERTSMHDLAAHTGAGNGSIYAAFGSKRGLFLSALEAYCGGRITLTTEALAGEGGAREAVRRYLLRIADDCTADPRRLGCLMVRSLAELADRDPEAVGICRRTLDAMEERIAARIGTGTGAGTLAHEILLFSQALIQAGATSTSRRELRESADAYVDRLTLA